MKHNEDYPVCWFCVFSAAGIGAVIGAIITMMVIEFSKL